MSNLPEISCDKCIAPGTCCKSFPLNHDFDLGVTPAQIKEFLETRLLPFEPQRRENVWCSNGQWKEQWRFSCPKLGADGRCTIYDNRPNLCKSYEPGTDLMCVHMRGVDGKPIIPQRP